MMNYETLEETLNGMLKTLSTPCIVGPHGIGKTSFVKAYAEKHGYHFVSFRLGQCSDVGDVLGRMVEANGRSAYLPLEVFPVAADKPVLLFLDEVNRTTRDLLQYIFEVIEPTEPKRLGSYIMPKGSRVVCAMNPEGGDYVVNSFSDAAFWSRLVKLEVLPTNDEFLKFVREGKVKDFFSSHREFISDRRAITQFAELYEAGLGRGMAAVVESMFGRAVGLAFQTWLQEQNTKVFTLEAVLSDKLPKKLSLSEKMQVCNLLRDAVQAGRCQWSKPDCVALKRFLLMLDKETFFTLAKDVEPGSFLNVSYMWEDKDLEKKFQYWSKL